MRIATLILFAMLAATAAADTVHLTNGKKIEGKIKAETAAFVEIETRFGAQKVARTDVAKIERGLTAIDQVAADRKKLDKADVAGRLALWKRAGELNLKKVRAELETEILALDPQNEDVNRSIGKVLFDGTFVTPAEKERLEQEKHAAEMLAQGLVPYKGGFVPPEDKTKLEQGLVKRDGKWIPEAEAMLADGLVKGPNGTWIKQEDGAIATTKKNAEEAVEHALVVASRDHVAAFTDVSEAFAGKLADLMEKGFRRFAKEFETDDALKWFAKQRMDLIVFRTRPDYERFCDWVGSHTQGAAGWSERARKVAGVYMFETWTFATTYVGNRGEDMAIGHCANMLGHVLLNRYRWDKNGYPPFFDESFAALMEFDLTGRNAFFNVGQGRYDRQMNEHDRAFFEDGNWIESFRDGIRLGNDTPMDQVVRRDYITLTQIDVAKGMALYQFWRKSDPKRMKTFFDAMREAWPGGNPPPMQQNVFVACQRAFNVACAKDMQVVDQDLRAWTMKKAD